MPTPHSQRPSRIDRPLRTLVLLLAALAAGCGGASAATSQPSPPLPVLPSAALPLLTATDTAVTAVDLTHDAPIAGFAAQLESWGYQRGTQRVFRGNQGAFTNVVSRTLQFGSDGGAAAYVRLVDGRVADFFGRGSKVAVLNSSGRRGYLIKAAPCGCHRETPILLAVLSQGRRVTWLYGTGPGARPARLRALLVQAP
ncbi:MAG: hypothetical protein QOG33_2093 [Gaiellales bacterium]|jgi:hypothetical protein|nr:hypothetical protein [Gaiellales bacterium]